MGNIVVVTWEHDHNHTIEEAVFITHCYSTKITTLVGPNRMRP